MIPDTDSTSIQGPDNQELANFIATSLSNRKAESIAIMDLREVTTLADFFVVCNGLSDVHVKSLANEIIEKVADFAGEKPWRKEGLDTRRWVVLDYVSIVVHIFGEDTRQHYNLEKMWSDAKIKHFED
ncbi:MAG: ribosome silencing factor [Balneolales bacterium]|nr:ribosome silencing factor [Balneolales bacterium]